MLLLVELLYVQLGSLNFNNALYFMSSSCIHKKSVFSKIPTAIFLLGGVEQKWYITTRV